MLPTSPVPGSSKLEELLNAGRFTTVSLGGVLGLPVDCATNRRADAPSFHSGATGPASDPLTSNATSTIAATCATMRARAAVCTHGVVAAQGAADDGMIETSGKWMTQRTRAGVIDHSFEGARPHSICSARQGGHQGGVRPSLRTCVRVGVSRLWRLGGGCHAGEGHRL